MIAILMVMLFTFVGCSDSIVTENEDGEKIFTLTAEEYLNNYNTEVGEYGADLNLKISDFEYTDDYDFYAMSLGDGMLFLHSDKDCTDFTEVYFSLLDEGGEDLLVGVLCLPRAFYPEDEDTDMNTALYTAYDTGSATYKNVQISCEKAAGLQNWSLTPIG